MTRDEIIETAVKAGMHIDVFTLGRNVDLLEAFAKLVAAKEREACALICEELKYDGYEMVKDNPTLARKIRARGQAS
jgi:hypothetical protein